MLGWSSLKLQSLKARQQNRLFYKYLSDTKFSVKVEKSSKCSPNEARINANHDNMEKVKETVL